MKFCLTSCKVKILLIFISASNYSLAQTNVSTPQTVEIPCNLTNVTAPSSESAVDILKIDCDILEVFTSSNEIIIEYDNCGTSYNSNSLQFLDANDDPIYVTNPDVSLVSDGGDIVYAIVVYYSPSEAAYFYEDYFYDKTSPTVLTRTNRILIDDVTQAPAINDNGIRIDANLQGDFVIVWDDLDNNEIYIIPGILNSGAPAINCQNSLFFPTTCSGTYIPIKLPFSDVTAADVAVRANDDPQQTDIYITYLSAGRDEVFVDSYQFVDLLYDNSTMNLFPNAPTVISLIANNIYSKNFNGDLFGRPRVAAPGEDVDQWTLVYRIDQNGDYHICGNTRNGSDYFHNYTDNTEPQIIEEGISVPANDWQDKPAVSYGYVNDFYSSDGAYVVWEGGWSSQLPTGTGGKTIVSVSIDNYGHVDANSCSPAGKLYKMVPDDLGTSPYDPYETYNPSIAGRHSRSDFKMVVAWWENTNQDIFKKDFYWCDVSFRQPVSLTTNPNYLQSKNNIVYPNPTNGQVAIKLNEWEIGDNGSIELFDVTGRRIFFTKGIKNSLEQNSRFMFQSLRPGVYFLKATNDTGRAWTQKVIKQ